MRKGNRRRERRAAKPMSEQSQSEREQRKAPAIQVAFKMAGAIHSADSAIVFER
jgi:hypothetical protein